MVKRARDIESKRYIKEVAMLDHVEKRKHQLMVQKEQDNYLRSQRQDTVQRIMRANEYKKQLILMKI